MHKLGISVLTVLYFGVGGLFGEFLRALFLGRVADQYQDSRSLVVVMVIGNLIGIPCLILLFKQRNREPRLETFDRSSHRLVYGLPVTGRIALLLFATAWVLGFVVSIVFAV